MRSSRALLVAALVGLAGAAVGSAGAAEARGATDEPAEAAVRELSVAPLESVRYPEDRPEWIEEPAVLDGEVHRWPIVSPPAESPEVARRDLQDQCRAALSAYVRRTFGDRAGWLADPSEISDEEIEASLIDMGRCYEGTVEVGGEPAHERAVELVFTPGFRESLQQKLDAQTVGVRLRRLAALGALGFAGLVTIGGFCRLVEGRRRGAS